MHHYHLHHKDNCFDVTLQAGRFSGLLSSCKCNLNTLTCANKVIRPMQLLIDVFNIILYLSFPYAFLMASAFSSVHWGLALVSGARFWCNRDSGLSKSTLTTIAVTYLTIRRLSGISPPDAHTRPHLQTAALGLWTCWKANLHCYSILTPDLIVKLK